MRPTLSPTRHIVVLGAGISGLTCSYYLKQLANSSGYPLQISLLEASARPGGWIATREVDGCLCELGARSVRPQGRGRLFLELIEQLDLQSKLFGNRQEAKARYLWHEGSLCPLPSSLPSLISSPLTSRLWPLLWRDLTYPKGTRSDETIYDFISHHSSSQFAERLFDPMMSGIFAGDIRQLSAEACLPQLKKLERAYGSLVWGLLRQGKKEQKPSSQLIESMQSFSLVSLQGGMEQLIHALAKELQGLLQLRHRCLAIASLPGGRLRIELEGATTIEADQVVSALPAPQLAKLLQREAASIAHSLERLASASSLVSLSLIWKKPPSEKKGFGYLVASHYKEAILGCVWDSQLFPQPSQKALMTVMMGGSHRPDLVDKPEDELLSIALEGLKRHMAIEASPDSFYLQRAERAIPQYRVGHLEEVASIEKAMQKALPRLAFIGQSFLGLSINDCLWQAYETAKSIFKSVLRATSA